MWDLPVRGFHALFVSGFLAAYIFSSLFGEDSPWFPYHSMIGLSLSLLVILRLLWALVGTRWARFTGLALDMRALFSYLAGVATGRGRRFVGHNPATSFTMLLMGLAVLGLAWSGVLLGQGDEGPKELHATLANGVLALGVIHVLGVAVHTLRHRDGIVLAMIDGRKNADESDSISGSALPQALVGLLLVGFSYGTMVASFDPARGTCRLPLLGFTLNLGEPEGGSQDIGSEANEIGEDD